MWCERCWIISSRMERLQRIGIGANVPFATGCGNDTEYGKCIRGAAKDFYGGIETDKLGELGAGYVLFYEMTGDKQYLMLESNVPMLLLSMFKLEMETHYTLGLFRVNARNGEVINGEE